MNKIYKTVWNAVRRCLVVVNEATKSLGGQSSGSGRHQGSICAQTPARHGIQSKKCFLSSLTLIVSAFLLAFSPFSSAQDYVLEKGKDYEFDSLTDIETFESRGAISLTFGSVNSPSGLMNIDIATKPGATYIPGTTQYLSSDIYHPEVLFKNDVFLGGFRWATGGTIEGNLTVVDNQTPDESEQYIQDCINAGGTAQLALGALILGGNEKRPIVVNGDISAPVLTVRSHSIRPDEGDYTYYGYNVINGDVTVDFLSTDNFTHYDDLTDYLEVSGTVTVQRDFYNNGSSNIKKLIVYGSFLNGNGEGTVAKLAMRQPFVLFKGLTFQKLCLPGAFRPGDHHNKMLRPGLCVVHASPQYL